jgi:hypothetical protein
MSMSASMSISMLLMSMPMPMVSLMSSMLSMSTVGADAQADAGLERRGGRRARGAADDNLDSVGADRAAAPSLLWRAALVAVDADLARLPTGLTALTPSAGAPFRI